MVRTPNAVFISSDEGTTWQPYFTEQPKLLETIYDLRKSGDFLIACSFRGIFRSVDEGKTWQPILWPPADRAGFFKIFSSEQTFYALLIEGC